MTDYRHGPPIKVEGRAPHKARPSTNLISGLDTTDKAHSNGTTSDLGVDKAVAASVDGSLWEALFDGRFRLAVQCDMCGRWLTATASKRAQRGPRCRAKAGRDG